MQRGDRWIDLKFEPLIYPTNSQDFHLSEGILLLLEDITDRKQVEENLDRQVHELRRLPEIILPIDRTNQDVPFREFWISF